MLCECRRRTMLSLWLVLALPSPFVRAQSSIKLVEESVERMPLIVSGAQGERSAILLVLPLERTSADGRRESADAVLIYEPTSQLGWWTYQHTSSTGDRRSTKFFLDNAVFHLTTDRLVCFSFLQPNLWIRESLERYPSLEQMRETVLETVRRMDDKAWWSVDHWHAVVNVRLALGGVNFAAGPEWGRANPPPDPKITQVVSTPSMWTLMLEAWYGGHARIVLGSDYHVISAERVATEGSAR